ncbi:MAG: efflux RND transporter periplasmic adaptor subunit [Desulfarculaceae bacterium]
MIRPSICALNRGWFLVPVLVLLALGVSACDSKKAQYAPPPDPQVTVSLPAQRDVINYAEYTGNTEAVESVEIRARVEGFLQSVNFRPSTMVKKGDLLFVIDPRSFEAQLNQAKADLAVAQANLKLAKATLTRKENAFKDRAVSEVAVIEAQAEKSKAEANVDAAKAAIEVARINLSYTKVVSPISGRVGRSLVDIGNLVGAGEATLLTTVVNDDPIYAYFNVSERDILHYTKMERMNKGPLREEERDSIAMGLSNEKGFPHQGKVDYIDNKVDTRTGTIQVRAVFPNQDHIIYGGLFVRVRVPLRRMKGALLVSNRALGSDQGGHYLFVVNQKGEVEYRKIQIGPLQDDGMRVILEGIKPEDKVIIKGIQRVRPGMKVKITEAGESKPQKPTGQKS